MDLKQTVLAGVSAAALVMAASSVSADALDQQVLDQNAIDQHILNQQIDVGIGNTLDGLGDFNAVAVAALQQNVVQIVTSNIDVVIDGNYNASMSFGENAFRNQRFNNNSFNTGVNSVQGNAMAISTTTHSSGGGL